MKLEIFASKDTIVGAFMKPFYAHNKNDAKRNWGNAIKLETMKEDYDPCIKDLNLYSLGEFNDETGEITSKVEYVAASAEFIYTGERKVCSTAIQEDQKELLNQDVQN